MMNFTTVTDWTIIKVIDEDSIVVSQHLFALVVNDTTNRFKPNDYVCTSTIKHITPEEHKIITHSGYTYFLDVEDEGEQIYVTFDEFKQLNQCFNSLKIDCNRKLNS
jgi:hypothetical protein